MCGNLGFVRNSRRKRSKKQDLDMLLKGLETMQYRGYDSCGICVMVKDKIEMYRTVGPISELVKKVDNDQVQKESQDYINGEDDEGVVGLGHVRWATSSIVEEKNTHPHVCSSSFTKSSFVVTHNGIITNYMELKQILLQNGYVFHSETDTEVVPVLCQYLHETQPDLSFVSIVKECLARLEGSYALLIAWTQCPGEIVCARRGSPLMVGRTTRCRSLSDLTTNTNSNLNGNQSPLWSPEHCYEKDDEKYVEHVFASDPMALAGWVDNIMYLQEGDIVHVNCNGTMNIENSLSGNQDERKKREVIPLDIQLESVSKKGYPDFMLKEICEQPESLSLSLKGRILDNGRVKLRGLQDHLQSWKQMKRMILIACGTSFNAALATRPLFEKLLQVPICIEIASDMMDRRPFIDNNDVCVFISQSGETADTMEALLYCKQKKALCVGIINRPGSTIARSTDCGVYLNCGSEIGVASTKAYTSQLAILTLLATGLSQDMESCESCLINQSLLSMSPLIHTAVLTSRQNMSVLASAIIKSNPTCLMMIGRGGDLATCHEAALKIKEISYIHAIGISAGELKHGPLALIDENSIVFVIATCREKNVNIMTAMEQIAARGGCPIIVGHEDDHDLKQWVHHASQLGTKKDRKGWEFSFVSVPRSHHYFTQGILNIIPFQLLAYEMGKQLGRNVDCPRNLAKSVTVH